MSKKNYDFCGWATRNDIKCSDGVTIRKNAFADCDGMTVPLVWNHGHSDPSNVLGHAILENRDEGVYTYGYFNDTQSGRDAKLMLQHGDINSLSIWANKLRKNGSDVMHGIIRELSLVLAGANPGAVIEEVICHGEVLDDEFVLQPGETIELFEEKEEKDISHAEEEKETGEKEKVAEEKKEKTVKDVIDSMTEEQRNVMYALIGEILSENGKKSNKEDEGDKEVKHNIFDEETENEEVLSHAEEEQIFSDAQRYGSLKESVLSHGITNIGELFPDAKNLSGTPEYIKRDTDWVAKVMNGTHHTPFSRIKSVFANITADEARAKGYASTKKGSKKIEEVLTVLKRPTNPTTIYKLQNLDRDDVIDITDFDVVAWIKSEMRMMLDEEIARAILVGDGRSTAANDKIDELCIRPIWTDDSIYTVNEVVSVAASDTASDTAKAFIKAAIKSRKNYKGSGNPTLFTTEDVLTDCLLIEDKMGRVIYDTEEKLRTALRVKEIVTVPVMENLTREVSGVTRNLMGIIVNLSDYNVGADKGGSVNMFDDFDIDYNKQKYLIETRCSGALVKPYAAIAIESAPAAETSKPEG